MNGLALQPRVHEAADAMAAIETHRVAAVAVENPAFDVTPARYADAIVTERRQFPPESIVTLMRELFGEGTTEPWHE